MRLHIALHNGFEKDRVIIRVDGQEVFNKAGISTLTQIGHADHVDTEVDGSPSLSTIEIDLPDRRLSDRLVLRLARPVYLGVTVSPEDGISYTLQYVPFRYA